MRNHFLTCPARAAGKWIWDRAALPKFVTIAVCCSYLLLLSGWITGLLNPPNSLEGAAGTVSIYLVSILVVSGALAGIPSAFAGQYRVERWALVAMVVGISIYTVLVYGLHWSSDSGNRLPQAHTIAALLPLFVARGVQVFRRPVSCKQGALVHRALCMDWAADKASDA